MGFPIARFRAAACSGLALITLLAVTPAAFAAPAPPGRLQWTGIAPAELPVDALPGSGQSILLDLLTPAALVTTGPVDLASLPRAATVSAAARVVANARSHLGARYIWGGKGPRGFDCSGLVLRAYSDAGLIRKLGGWGNRSGYALYAYGRRHHLVSTTNGHPGDVVVWGGGGHVGIYLGHGMAISALVNGVRIHGLHSVTKRFTAFIHTGLSGKPSNGAPSTASAKAASNVRYTTVTLRLRTAAGTSATIVRTLSGGTRLLVQRSARDSHHRVWYHVQVGSSSGWVAGWLTRT